ncbi:MAG TPA: insulinase family protein, partial [Verrucomicrobiae bacterium]|nr:insulinase family protein [Verrucomicrobiae bacterium]
MTKGVFLLQLLAAFCCATASGAPLPEDPRILKGQLENGVHWMYRQHDNPPGKMAIQMHVRTGSLNETDEQRGLAHFLEHMAFNGTENFPPGKLVPYFESIGMQFGPHLNAYTSFDQTVYMLYTPNTEAAQIEKALLVMSDYAFRMQLSGDEVNKERGIVLEESRSRKSAMQRIQDRLYPELFEGSRFGVRMPIGKDEVIAKAPREQFTDYYRTWYRPENITVMLVGDASPDHIIPLIKKTFGEYKPRVDSVKAHGPDFRVFLKERALVETDPEMAYCYVQMMNLRPGRPATTTTEGYRVDLVDYLGSWIMGRRYNRMVQRGEASFRGASVGVNDFFKEALLAQGSANGNAEDWGKMLTQLISEVARAQKFGFSPGELALARRELLADAERAVRTESTRNARVLLGEMVRSVNDREPVLSAEQTLDLYKKLLPEISIAEVNGAFGKHFEPGTFAYVVVMSGKEGVKVPKPPEVLAVAKEALAGELSKGAEEEIPDSVLEKLPEPARVVEKSADKDLGVTSVWLENGARVHHRFMDYKKDSVLVSISLAGGTLEESATNSGVTQVASLILDVPATSKLPSTAIRDIMTGKNISVNGGSGGDHLSVSVSGSPLDLEPGLQLAYALLTDGKLEPAAFNNWKLSTLQEIEDRETNPQFKAYEAMEELLSGGDPRRGFIDRGEVDALSVPQAQQWFDRICKTAPIEVAIVGDIQLEPALALAQKYIGGLPKRNRTNPNIDKLRASPRPPGPLERNITVPTVTPKAMALAGFAGAEGRATHDVRGLDLAQKIISSRMVKRIREELSIVYSISASQTPAWVYTDAGRFSSGAPCDPKNAKQVIEEIHKILDEFAEKGPAEEELVNAKKQMKHQLDNSLPEPGYWFSVLRNLDLRKRDLAAEKS